MLFPTDFTFLGLLLILADELLYRTVVIVQVTPRDILIHMRLLLLKGPAQALTRSLVVK